MSESTHGRLREGILNCDADQVEQAARSVLADGEDINAALSVLTAALRDVGEMFARMEIYLPELMLAGDAMKAGVNILEQGLVSQGQAVSRAGTVVLGTVKGDMHDIGKDLVASMLRVSGFEVCDLGIDVPATKFVEKAQEVRADIIGISSLLTTSQASQWEVVKFLCDAGLRSKYHIIIGGGAMSPEWAARMGADGYSEFASGASELCRRLLSGDRVAGEGAPVIC